MIILGFPWILWILFWEFQGYFLNMMSPQWKSTQVSSYWLNSRVKIEGESRGTVKLYPSLEAADGSWRQCQKSIQSYRFSRDLESVGVGPDRPVNWYSGPLTGWSLFFLFRLVLFLSLGIDRARCCRYDTVRACMIQDSHSRMYIDGVFVSFTAWRSRPSFRSSTFCLLPSCATGRLAGERNIAREAYALVKAVKWQSLKFIPYFGEQLPE